VIVLPAMAESQEAAWHGLLDLYEAHRGGWTLIGGQLVHLHCAERGYSPQRPTDDADAVVDARQPNLLGAVTSALIELGFAADVVSADGIQHRWKRGKALIDVLVPEGMGERATARRSASGFPTLATPGGTQALNRSDRKRLRLMIEHTHQTAGALESSPGSAERLARLGQQLT
jgi:hypothetical protein